LVKQNKKKTISQNDSKNSKNLRIIVIICIIISAIGVSFIYVMNFNSTTVNSTTVNSTTVNSTTVNFSSTIYENMDGYIEKLHSTHTFLINLDDPYFDMYVTYDDKIRLEQNLVGLDGVRVEFNESFFAHAVEQLKPNADDNSVVIYPIWTSAAYYEPGFYTYYRGDCDISCITDISFENAIFEYTSSGLTAQILYHVGYDFLTDDEVDKNPELLKNYDTVILLHNEYVTKKEFNAITSHPNLIFLQPNALYAEIDVNHETKTMTLIRGHDYPPENPVENGFDYEIEQKFHDYEYDAECLEWEFIEITNGVHLNCYPDVSVQKLLNILVYMKELT